MANPHRTAICQRCDMASLCEQEAPYCRTAVVQRQLDTGAPLHWAGEPLNSVAVIKSGCVKSYAVDMDGQERVRGFAHPGDVVGLDALHTTVAQATVEALTPTTVCVVPTAFLRSGSEHQRPVQKAIMHRLSRELEHSLTLAGAYTAEQRLAWFLLNFSERCNQRSSLHLTMGRRDIANYLRLVTETISRVLRRFSDKGLIRAQRRDIEILDRAGLEAIASPVAHPECTTDQSADHLHNQAA